MRDVGVRVLVYDLAPSPHVFFPSLTPPSVLHFPCHLFERLTDDRLIIIIAS